MTAFTVYSHHGVVVWTNADTKGKHRDFCLCYSCELFKPEEDDNCEIAQEIFDLDVKHSLVTPVFECPAFRAKGKS